MPVPPGTPLVILIGGTFDPPHRAHVELPVRARKELELRAGCAGRGVLVYIPAARSPLKVIGPRATDAERVAMLAIALAGVPRAGIWTDEIDRAAARDGAPPPPSYTVDTVARARAWLDTHACRGAILRLLIGADQAIDFHRWREPQRIIELAEPAVMLRPPVRTREDLVRKLRDSACADTEIEQWTSRIVDTGVIDAAATSVRGLLASPPVDLAALGTLLSPGVIDYITSHRLYGCAGSPPAGAPPPRPAPG
jgi:nicotinate-nucleotide adenylyltransferase